jgi:hypothetical protein
MKTTSSVPTRKKRNEEVKYFSLRDKRKMLAPYRDTAFLSTQFRNDDYPSSSNGPHVRYLLFTLVASFFIALIMYILILLYLFA